MRSEFEHKTYLITGGSSGIGLGCAQHLADAGASLVLCARDAARLEQAQQALGNAVTAVYAADLTQDAQRDALVAQLPALDGIVHSAGIGALAPVRFIDSKHFETVFAVNTQAPCLLTSAVVKAKKLRESASVVFIASVAGIVSEPGYAVYSASKSALYGMVRAMAVELARSKVRVNALSPGHVHTAATARFAEEIGPELVAAKEALYPLGFGTVDDVARTVLFLLSDGARWITGTNIVADGGFSIR